MKKIFFAVLVLMLSLNQFALADNSDSENIVLLTKKGFFENSAKKNYYSSPTEEIRKTFLKHLKYSNSHDLDSLSSMYTDSYFNEDGLNKKVYFDLIKKTWSSYPDIKYKIYIKDITVNDNTAVVHVNESATATTSSRSGVVNESGNLQSFSDTIYYLEKTGGQWLVTTDKIIYEKTFLLYGSAKLTPVNLIAPSQLPAGKTYTASLQITPGKDSFIIASIGQEFITYPQDTAPEVFRKLPPNGILERIFTANSKDLNEYAVASYGITKAEVKDGKEIKISVTGLGFVMQRVNIIPKNNYVKAIDEKAK